VERLVYRRRHRTTCGTHAAFSDQICLAYFSLGSPFTVALPAPMSTPDETKVSSKYVSGWHQRSFRGRSLKSDRLPHLKIEGGTYFVTYRLADSLPQKVLADMKRELAQKIFPPEMPLSEQEAERNRERFRRMESWLDKGLGSCCLRRPEIGQLVEETMRFFHGTRYELLAWVIMPNHVHALLKPLGDFALGEIVKSWKQFSARRAKPLTGWTEKQFWQIESYDHWVRDAEEKGRIIRYIHRNPVKAGFCVMPEDWLWSSANKSVCG
jgi:REP element-mobilizing transposase RayT